MSKLGKDNKLWPMMTVIISLVMGGWVLLLADRHLASGKQPTHKQVLRKQPKVFGGWESPELRDIWEFHRQGVVIDLHSDTLYRLIQKWYDLRKWQEYGDVDIPKLRAGGVNAQVFAMFVLPKWVRKPGDGWRILKRMYAHYQKMLKESGGVLVHARNVDDIRRITGEGKIAALLGLEGLHPLEGDMQKLEEIASWGLMYVGLTWNNSNAFALSIHDEARHKRAKRRQTSRDRKNKSKGKQQRTVKHPTSKDTNQLRRSRSDSAIKGNAQDAAAKVVRGTKYKHLGLSDLGRRAVRMMEQRGILIDVSHASEQSFWDVIEMAQRPIIASHSNALSVCGHLRNLNDRQLQAIARNGGVVGINFYTYFLKNGPKHHQASIKTVVRHIDHIVRVAGIDHVALGTDYDGIDSRPVGLRHIGDIPRLTLALQKRGYSRPDLRKFLGENALRVWAVRSIPATQKAPSQ